MKTLKDFGDKCWVGKLVLRKSAIEWIKELRKYKDDDEAPGG